VTASTSAPPGEILRAMFPCASITGAPKVKTMQIIKALEPEPRGIYTGSIGYIAPGRQMQFNVAIRTLLLDMENAAAEYGVGGGVTWYSEVRSEYEECFAKASVLNRVYPEFELLESIAWDDKQGYYLLDGHLKRLEDSGEYFGFELSIPSVKSRLLAEQSGFEGPRRKIRLLVSRNGDVTIESTPINSMEGMRVSLGRSPINTLTPFVYHKTTNRFAYTQALSAKSEGDEDIIFWNANGFVTETSIANVVIDDGRGRLVTPHVRCGLLAGVQRSHLLEQKTIHEDMVTVDDLRKATRVYLINSVRGWMRLEREAADRWVVKSEQFTPPLR
jgi:para-aminobenzoate synthetase/4-amino-4-deoxychorismate lyase